jgi:hypothetical protein
MNKLSKDEINLGLRFFGGEITEIQFNFICYQKKIDKEKILEYTQQFKEEVENVNFWASLINPIVAIFILFLLGAMLIFLLYFFFFLHQKFLVYSQLFLWYILKVISNNF